MDEYLTVRYGERELNNEESMKIVIILTGVALLIWAAISAILHIIGPDPISDVYLMDLPLAIVGAICLLVGWRFFKNENVVMENDQLFKKKHGKGLKKETAAKKVVQEQPRKTEIKPKPTHGADATTTKTIFLSYRRKDSADVSGRIYDRLSIKYGKDQVFKDVDSIPLGVDFRSYIDDMVSRADIFLAVIGPDWLGVGDAKGKEINNPRDFVRLEVRSALERKIPVVPLLVRNGSMPSETDLPSDIKGLAYRNGIPIRSDPDFDNDITRLLSGLSRLSNRAKAGL